MYICSCEYDPGLLYTVEAGVQSVPLLLRYAPMKCGKEKLMDKDDRVFIYVKVLPTG